MFDFFPRWYLFGFLSWLLFGFPRKELSFSFLPSSLPFCFFLQCVLSSFWVWVVSLNFLKISISIRNFAFTFCKFVHNQVDIFPAPVTFFFTIATIFPRDSRQQNPFMHKCNSTPKTLSSIANQTASLPLAMRLYHECLSLVGYASYCLFWYG